MYVIRDLDEVKFQENCILTIGTFDGIHLGHQSIIENLLNSKKTKADCATIITFEPHPQFIIESNKKNIKLLTTIEEKIEILKSFDIDRLIIIPFTKEFSQINSLDFLEKILIKKIGFNKIIIGYDHAFGKNRHGNIDIIKKLASGFNFEINLVSPLSIDNTIISSTIIRELLLKGDVAKASEFLSRNYSLRGKVIKGEGLGRKLNAPTANLSLLNTNKLIPKDGIYAVWATFSDKKYKSVLYIGNKPTFLGKQHSIELNVFNFSGDLYDQVIEIEFIDRIRDDIKFNNTSDLITQINIDKQKARQILDNK